jgi:dihydrofolate synthase/folylpolyglutamate synthase
VLVDAAHNPHGAAALAAALREYFDFDEYVIVLGVLADKDAHGIVRELASVAARVDVTRSSSERAIPAEELAELVRDDVEPDAVLVHEEFADAMDAARAWAAESPRRAVVVTGSITLVGEALTLAAAEGWKP